MKRRQIFLLLFCCWGLIIGASSMYLILSKQQSLLAFSERVAEEEIIYYPLRAPIVDRNGQNVCHTDWIFYIKASKKQKNNLMQIVKQLEIQPQTYTADNQTEYCILPKEKLSSAVILCRKYRLKIHKRITRNCIDLPENVKTHLGKVLLYNGLYGLEAKYNSHLQGTPGVYQAIKGPRPLNSIEKNTFRILAPMRPGRMLKLKQSIPELQCGILPEIMEAE